jgi:cobalamin biosynthetic protein CobC
MLEHGGRRRAAAQRYGIPEADWLDLSTGINPLAYPVPVLPPEAWNRLPEDDDGLAGIAAGCYGAAGELLPLAGSQAAIQALPKLFSRGRVAVLQPSYAEHRHHWQAAGHAVQGFAADALEEVASAADVVVLCNPNNPDGHVFAPARLLAAAAMLQTRGGHLVVDEAFVDALPGASVIAHAGHAAPNLIVLRSLGKFYGLAGARVGFVAAAAPLRESLRQAGGPWPLAGPARWVAAAALADATWQQNARIRLRADSARLAGLLSETLADPRAAAPPVENPLFVWLPRPDASALAERLARRGVLVRHFAGADGCGLRFGLPGPSTEWRRLAATLKDLA